MKAFIPLDPNRFRAVHTSLDVLPSADGTPMARVVKTDRLLDFDINSYVCLQDMPFCDGTIEVDVCSRLLPDAPDFARGFLGIAFRIAADDSQFESFYLRPTNGRFCTDPARRQHAVQYFSFPRYTFDFFRTHGITCYEAPAPIALNEWIHIKASVQGSRAAFYLNGSAQPVLSVEDLKLGPGARGSVGFFVDIGTEGFFKNLRITPADAAPV